MKFVIVIFIVIVALLNLSNLAQANHITNPAEGIFVDFGGDNNTFGYLFGVFLNALLGLAGIAAILFLVIGGFQYMTSGANQEMAETGKKTVTNAIIGIVVIILSYVIVNVINNILK
ncbi:MAG: hypothetical protein A3E98_01535 [Candidatus Doudnabacteria bacterium RIFCSPHIGHO2_12_FULL_48_11]|uniref:Uncharacterized protein n=1 Tax=Candidatus Doudnabacteria bacterium RIFCSPHIGHO2_01_FULL_46_24 TaxID=1817825 RepID=A0A1F5NW81_9BACT|nr:MAG: hypothetical protein A2720_00105 [Candidatus Doudnabacteria bacterium RIFCSPHIGHO2_01_FULL_46_24]OGE95511.1 MAG: hypothetical protein A3E98_01535 [Candidatus Doudnabacteria bacterium RIFCSPHIGHO2_12_FULL_48_11]